MKKLIIIIAFLSIIIGNTYASNTKINNINPIDTNKSFKIDNYWLTPDSAFDFNSLGDATGDTLDLVTCSDYVYSPFGEMTNKKQLKKSLLNNFDIKDRTDKLVNGVFEFQILKLNTSKLILFFDDDEEATRESYIYKGEIYDKEVKFLYNISIGMNKKDFILKFFETFPDELLGKFNVIRFQTCVYGTYHVYTFKENILNSVIFQCIGCTWNLDY